MAKKSPSTAKPAKAAASDVAVEAEEPKSKPAPPAATVQEKSSEDQSGGSIGVADIKKAVSFANSVGGLEKATALLQILKVAKDVQ